MYVVLVLDILLVEPIGVDLLLAVTCAQQVQKVPLELLRVLLDFALRVLTNKHHLPQVTFAHGVALEPVLVPALLLANLAVPAESLQAARLHLIRHILGRSKLCFPHGVGER